MKTWITCLLGMVWLSAQSQITLIKKDESCAGKKDGRIEVKVEGVSSSLEYAWTKDNLPFGGGKIIAGLAPGDYRVTVTAPHGCMGFKSAKIWGGQDVSVDISARLVDISPHPVPCGVRPTFTYQLTAIPSGGKPPYYCSWGESNGSGTTHTGGGANNECSKTVTGSFINESVTIIDSAGCVDSDGFKQIAAIQYCPKDPNDITGPDGYDTVRWVSVHDELNYAVRFENDPDFATSNAATVLVTIPIDDDIDPFSFRLSVLGFGTHVIEVPANATFVQQRIDYADELGLLVDITAGLDLPNNRFFWLMESIDPVTGQPPTDPTAGFLPVNDTLTGSGEGFLNFSCKPKSSTLTGEVVDMQASIVFDLNEVIPTNIWSNRVDAFAPTTAITSMPDTFYTNQIPFAWNPTDDSGGCGVQYTEILLSTDNAIFETNGLITDTMAQTIPLNWGTTYFYKVESSDFVNNVEDTNSDSFYIVPHRAIDFVTPDQSVYCIGDTLQVKLSLISMDEADLYISIDSGSTFTLLATDQDTSDYAMILDSSHLHPYLFLKAVNAENAIEAVSFPFTVKVLPVVDAGDPVSGCDGDILFVNASGANAYRWSSDSIIATPFNRFSNVYASTSQFAYVAGTDVYGCTNIDSVLITVHPLSRDTLTQPLCQGDSVLINGDWVEAPGFYSSTFSNEFGCDSIVVSEVVFQNPCIWQGGPYVFVDEDATGLENGTSWANAFTDLQDALYVAGRYENVQEIWIAEGVYKPHLTRRDTSFVLRDSIKIYGGFVGVETSRTERTSDATLVQLSGDINVVNTLTDNSFHTVLLSSACTQCVLDGLTITYGHADQASGAQDIGAGVINYGHAAFTNVVFERNFATDLGAALYSTGANANVTIENCTFQLNTSSLGRDVVNLSGALLEFKGANAIH